MKVRDLLEQLKKQEDVVLDADLYDGTTGDPVLDVALLLIGRHTHPAVSLKLNTQPKLEESDR